MAFDGHIADHMQRAQFARERHQRGGIEIAERQARAAPGKFTGQSRADAACGSGQDHYLVLEFQRDLLEFWHLPPPWMGCADGCTCASVICFMGMSFCA